MTKHSGDRAAIWKVSPELAVQAVELDTRRNSRITTSRMMQSLYVVRSIIGWGLPDRKGRWGLLLFRMFPLYYMVADASPRPPALVKHPADPATWAKRSSFFGLDFNGSSRFVFRHRPRLLLRIAAVRKISRTPSRRCAKIPECGREILCTCLHLALEEYWTTIQ